MIITQVFTSKFRAAVGGPDAFSRRTLSLVIYRAAPLDIPVLRTVPAVRTLLIVVLSSSALRSAYALS